MCLCMWNNYYYYMFFKFVIINGWEIELKYVIKTDEVLLFENYSIIDESSISGCEMCMCMCSIFSSICGVNDWESENEYVFVVYRWNMCGCKVVLFDNDSVTVCVSIESLCN